MQICRPVSAFVARSLLSRYLCMLITENWSLQHHVKVNAYYESDKGNKKSLNQLMLGWICILVYVYSTSSKQCSSLNNNYYSHKPPPMKEQWLWPLWLICRWYHLPQALFHLLISIILPKAIFKVGNVPTSILIYQQTHMQCMWFTWLSKVLYLWPEVDVLYFKWQILCGYI